LSLSTKKKLEEIESRTEKRKLMITTDDNECRQNDVVYTQVGLFEITEQ